MVVSCSGGDVAGQMKHVLERLAEVEVLPHHFDETLLDKLIEFVDFSDPKIAELLREELSSDDVFERSSMYTSVLLRLLGKAIERKAIDGLQDPFHSFLDDLPNFLYQQRPPWVIGSLFRLCTVSLYFRTDWNDVLTWAANNFSDALTDSGSYRMTVFVRNRAEELFCGIVGTETIKEQLQTLARIFENEPVVDSPYVLNSVARIAETHDSFFSAHWNVRKILENLIGAYPTGRGLSAEIYDNLTKNLTLTDQDMRLLASKPSFAISFWQSYARRYANLPDGVEEFLLSRCSLDQLEAFYPRMLSEGKLELLLEAIRPWLNDSKRTNESSLLRLLQSILPLATTGQISCLLDDCVEIVANSPAILNVLAGHNPVYLSRNQCPKLTAAVEEIVKSGFPNGQPHDDWDQLEQALETACVVPFTLQHVTIGDDLLYHENDYVALAAFKCLRLKQSADTVAETCVRLINGGIHSQPKLEALKYLDERFPVTTEQCLSVLERGLDDDDNENRWMALDIGRKLLDERMESRGILEKYADDYLIGLEVRSLLRLPPPAHSDRALKTLEDILSGLDLLYVDVPDCS